MRKFIFIMTGLVMMASLVSAQNCTELFFSEYLEGSGNNKGMEIYNPTNSIINLGDYWVARYSNGNNTYTAGGITQLQGFIQPYSTHLLVNGQLTSTETSPASDPNLRALAQQLDGGYPSPTYMNGNDAIALFKKVGTSGTDADFQVIDLFGIVGGGMTSGDEGWASFTNAWIYKNIYVDNVVVGKDSAYVSNFIVPESYYWVPWTSNHALVRKPFIKQGVTVQTMPTVEFNVTIQWDTVPGGVDVWDSLNAHYCHCQFPTAIEREMVIQSLSIYPNPAQSQVTLVSDEGLFQIQVLDIAGKLVGLYDNLSGTREKTISLEELEQGIYFLRVDTGNRFETRKLLKQ